MSGAVRIVLAFVLAAGLGGVAGCWGGGADVRNSNRSTTVGQELIDLQRAYDSGLIDEREYNRQRKRILKRRD